MSRILLIVALLFSPLVKADPTPEHLNKVEELFAVMDLKNQLNSGFDAMTPMIDELSKNLKLNEAESKEFREIYREWFEKDIDREQIIKDISKLYADTFTIDDLDQLISFYETPIGKKALEKMPLLMQEGAKIGMQAAQEKQGALQMKIEAFYEKIEKKRAEADEEAEG